MRSFSWRLLSALLVSLLAAACSDLPTVKSAGESAQLGFSLDLSTTNVNSVSVQVTAPDISQTLVYNIPVSGGTASGHIDVPAGAARTITVRAYDPAGAQTHEGSTTVDVKPGSNPPVVVTLIPRAGELPISVSFGSVFIRVTMRTYPEQPNGYSIGSMPSFQAEVTTPDGTIIPDAVIRWASLDPTVMTVNQNGDAYAAAVGTTEIVATWNGYGAAILVHVASGPDYEPPQLHGMAFDKQVVHYTGTPQSATLNISITDQTSGIGYVDVHLRSMSMGNIYPCAARPTGTAGLWRCTWTINDSMPLGEYVVEFIEFRDSAGNGMTYYSSQLWEMGMAARFMVQPY